MEPKILSRVIDFEKMSYVKEDDAGHVNLEDMIDCALGINPFGYSDQIGGENEESVRETMNHYPGYPYDQLREDIAEYWKDTLAVDPRRVVIGSGSMGLLYLINKMFVDGSTKVLGYCPQFTEYISDVRSLGGHYEYILLKANRRLKFDIDELIEKLDESYSLVYIDNPNNPTGQITPLSDLRRIAGEAQRQGVCVLVDEAYGDFMEKSNSAVNLVDEFDNVFVVRSLSKGFGLAGIRVGYMMCSEALLPYYKKVEQPFSITDYGAAVAIQAVKDKSFISNSIERIAEMKQQLLDTDLTIEVMETDVTVPIMVLRHPDESVNLHAELMKHKVLAESGDDFIGLGQNAVRLRVPKEMDRLLEALKEI